MQLDSFPIRRWLINGITMLIIRLCSIKNVSGHGALRDDQL